MKNTLLFLFIVYFSVSYAQVEKKYTASKAIKHNAFSFLENKGQWDEDILFKSSFKGGNLWVQRNKLLFHLQDFQKLRKGHGTISRLDTNIRDLDHLLYLSFKNSIKVKTIQKVNSSKEYYNFFIGNDKNRWASDVHAYTTIELSEIYSGINLRLIQEDEQLKYEFIVAPDTDPNQIQLEFFGANSTTIDREGRLHISTPLGEIIEKKPFVYQNKNGKKQEIESRFQIIDDIVSFQLGNYNSDLPLIIDPVLVFATYNGAYSDNFGMTATYGHDGTAYSGGTVFGSAYPTIDPAVVFTKTNLSAINYNYTVHACSDIFISKYSADGSKMLWSTFLGGGDYTKGAETVHSLICDKDNNIYGFGASSSADFPVTSGCFQNNHNGGNKINIGNNGAYFGKQGTDIITFKLSQNGHQLLGSTYIGGSGNDGLNYNYSGEMLEYNNISIKPGLFPEITKETLFIPYDSLTSNYGDQFRGEIMLDSSNNILIASSTRSSNFPTKFPFQSTLNGKQEGVIFKLKNDFSELIFSSYFGGNENDAINSVKIDSAYNIIFCGGTCSSDLQTTNNSYQKNYGGGKADGFIGRLSSDGKKLKQLTYVGSNLYDQAFIIESNINNDIYILGHSIGGNFPVKNASYSIPKSTQFLAKFDSTLSNIINSTVFGNGDSSKSNFSPSAMLVDDCKNIYVSGWGGNLLEVNFPEDYLTGIIYIDPITSKVDMTKKPIFQNNHSTILEKMPISNNAFQKNSGDGYNFYLFVINDQLSKLVYGSYLGGDLSQEHVDGGTSRFDKKGVIYQSVCGGCGKHSDFPVSENAWSKTNNSNNCNNLVFKFDFELIPPLKLKGDTKVCVLQTDSIYVDTQNIDQKFTFDWSPKKYIQSYPSTNSAIIKIDSTQTFKVKATGDLGCVITESISISLKSTELLKTLASATKTNVIKGDKVQLFAKPDGYTYQWTPEEKVISQTQNTEAIIWENTIFKLKVSDGPCTVSDTILIKVIQWECDFPFVFVPNAFSPNGDNENDVLYVRGHPIKSIEFRVFNRWGEMVFESRDISSGWDGTYKGKLVDPDVFDYYLNVECVGEEHKLLQGNITVLR